MENNGPLFPDQIAKNAMPPAPEVPKAPLNTLALWSFICALVGCIILPTFLIAPVLGFIALSRQSVKTGVERGRGLAKAGVVIGLIGIVMTVALVWVGVHDKLSTNSSVADKTALSVAFDATSIAAISDTAPNVSALSDAISEGSGVSVLYVNGAPLAKVGDVTLHNVELAVSVSSHTSPYGVCLHFPGKVNAAPTVVSCS